ncbi:MAG TPA: FKBP-type peptidyl-prolyl cis-trans isomerase [Acidimicrobiales bacterium]|nr:FKBP-type peptidyl-prolyl cis-trans isomerase [Acidimicrobiales bacterium]
MPRARYWCLGALGVAVVALAGCGSSSASPPTSKSTPSTTAPTTVATTPVQSPSPAGTFGTAPTITVPPGAPPTQLESSDLIVGTGPVVKLGDKVTAQYVLATYSTRQQIQSSWTSGPFSFVLAKGNVIDGWVDGVAGMRVGGRRELVIPPSLGYGAQSPGQGIAPNDTLVFIVDVVKVG